MTGSAALPLVTIAIPTFNRAGGLLRTSLAAARAQTYSNVEIFVSDNASEDNTQAFVESLNDSRIRYHRHLSNIGSTANMNFCIEQAKGEFTVIVPDDDLVDPDFVELCMRAVDDRVGIVRSGTRVIDGDGRMLNQLPNLASDLSFDDLVVAWFENRTAPYQCSTLYRTRLLQSIGLHSRHHLFDDVMTFFRLAAESERRDIPDVKASFRQHSDELTAAADIRAWCGESMDLLDLLCMLSPSNRRVIRTRGLKFLARGNYRRAFRRPFPASMFAAFTVFRTHHYTPPPLRSMARARLRETRREESRRR
jgi:glycosyltransferase involved in cell wall biosynthesis